jgi:hypothetical protein
MDINSIELTSRLLSELYSHFLVEINTENPPKAAIQQPEKRKWLGENRKNILAVVNYAETKHIPDDQLGFLINLLSACKLSLADVAVFNFHSCTADDFNDILADFSAKTVLLFGVEPAAFGMPVLFPAFQVQPFRNCTFLFSPSLQELEKDKVLKSKLWVCLKKIFNLTR